MSKPKLECNGDPDREYFNEGYDWILGIDEAGRGPICGPMYLSIVAWNINDLPELATFGLKDSKKLSDKKRRELARAIKCAASETTVVKRIPAQEIDSAININDLFDMYATMAYKELVRNNYTIKYHKHILLVDGNRKINGIPQDKQFCRPRLDATSWAVAAASIVAKDCQVFYMEMLHKDNSEYGFDRHRGYGTKTHFEAIRKNGFCKEHRRTWIKL
jgi:ribonuclease HII